MSDDTEAWERDLAWLRKQGSWSDEQEENFCEAVAKHWQECGDEELARNRAMRDIRCIKF